MTTIQPRRDQCSGLCSRCRLADAHILALEYSKAGHDSDAFNLGSSRGFSNKQMLDAAREVTGKPIPAIMAPRRAGDPSTLVAASDKARTV